MSDDAFRMILYGALGVLVGLLSTCAWLAHHPTPCIVRCINSGTPADAPGGMHARQCQDSYRGSSVRADKFALPPSCSVEWLE